LRAYTFRDAELRSRPLRLLNAAGALLRRAGANPPSLTAASIEAAARDRAKTQDLGGDSYREPLEVYVSALESQAQLTTFGRIAVRGMLVRSLTSRARLHSWSQEHPEVRQEKIEQPWVILGLPRTGTSILSQLIGLDPLARPPLHWETASPIPPPTLADAAEDPRIAQTAKDLDRLLGLNPALRAMHPFGATLAEECVAFFLYDLRSLAMETQGFVPSYGRWLESCDMSPAYAQHKLALQTLQSVQPTERWILKTPNHLWCPQTLLSTYPDARVVWTHRDPGPVIASLASLNNALQRTFTSKRDPAAVGNEWRTKAFHGVSSGMDFDASADPGWCQHVLYRDLLDDPVATVERIYANFGESVGSLHRRRMEAWLRDRHQGAFGRHEYDPADFGWSYDDIATQFDPYRKRYDIPREA
jgi:hypothetical protein